MTSPMVVLRTLPWRRLLRPGRMLATALLLGGLAIGGMLALRTLKPATPTAILPGQALAWDIARSAARSAEVQTASGAYVPGRSMILYSRTSHTDQAAVRSWATTELQPFADRLAGMPSDESFVWVIDYGAAEAAQEVITAPLTSAVDPQQFTYVSAAPDLAVGIATAGEQPAASAAPAPAASAAPPPAASAAPAVNTAPAASVAPAPAASSAPAPAPVASAAPAPAVAGEPTPLLNTDFAGSGAGAIQGWNALSGDWSAHDGIYSQRQTDGFDYISMLDLPPQTTYILRAKLRLGEGKGGGGFVYNAPNGTTRNGAQNVDLTDSGSFLRWGRYDENGNYAYGGGVKLDTPLNDGQWHALELKTEGAKSQISVDGKPVGEITNNSASGYLGLTSSQMLVDYDDVEVLSYAAGASPAPQPSAAPSAAPTGNVSDNFDDGDTKGWQVLTGTWQNIDKAYQQNAASGSDLGSISPFTGSSYKVSVRLKRLGGDMGAGLYFNLAQRDKKAESQMINYTQGGKALQWGHFDEGGNFVFDGSAEVKDGNDGEWHTLTVEVKDGTARFTLDDAEVAKDVKLTYTSGYVGLLASNSVVAFDDVTITAQ